MNQAKRYDIVMAVCMLPVLAALVLSIYYFRIAYLHYKSAQDIASLVVTIGGVITSLLVVPYTTISVHEHGHKYLFYLAGAESTISNKDTSYTLSFLHFLKQFIKFKDGFGWITNTDIPDFDKRLLKRDPMMYILVCSAGILANILISTLLVLPLVIANIEIGWYSCSVSLYVLIYTLYTLAEYCINIFSNRNENRDGFKARSALNGMDESTVVQEFVMKLKAILIYMSTKLLLSAFYLFENPIYFVAVALIYFLSCAIPIKEAFEYLIKLFGFFFILFHLLVRIMNESVYLKKFNNELMMYPALHSTDRYNNRKKLIDVLTDYYVRSIIKYCDTFSINRFLKRSIYIKTYQVTIDAFRARFPDFRKDLTPVKYAINWNRLLFIKPNSVFNHLGYKYITRKEACYKFKITHEEVMELRRMIASEPS